MCVHRMAFKSQLTNLQQTIPEQKIHRPQAQRKSRTLVSSFKHTRLYMVCYALMLLYNVDSIKRRIVAVVV
jgi:hypothetical protein